MKRFIIRICVCSLLVTAFVRSCPTCIGRVDVDTPPLFSQEYEKLYALYDDEAPLVPSQESLDEA
jgi:hypothetical protein